MFVKDFTEISAPLLKLREEGKRVLIVTHVRPDGDAISSSAGLCTILNDNGWCADVLYHTDIPDNAFPFLPQAEHLVSRDGFDAVALNGKYAMVISVDSSTADRTFLNGISPAEVRVSFAALDHHPDHKEFAQITYVDGKAAAAAQIVTRFAQSMNLKISPWAASQLLFGITTDSGGFKFDNTNAQTHRITADLLDLGADHHLVMEKAFFSKSRDMVLFEADELCSHLHFNCDGKFVWLQITDETLQKHHVDIKNTETLVEAIRQMDGITVAAVVKPTGKPDDFRVSLRSKDLNVSVGNVARGFGGGGHEMAAGCNVQARDIADLEKILSNAVQMEMDRANSQKQ